MTLDDFKTFVYVLFHVLVINKMFFKLLGQLRRKGFDVLDLLGDLASDFHNLFVDISTEEMSSLSRVMCCVFHILNQLLHSLVTQIFDSSNLDHDILDQVLNKHLSLFVS